jgi:hypothetical protein
MHVYTLTLGGHLLTAHHDVLFVKCLKKIKLLFSY